VNSPLCGAGFADAKILLDKVIAKTYPESGKICAALWNGVVFGGLLFRSTDKHCFIILRRTGK
jgi:hypothetical protein